MHWDEYSEEESSVEPEIKPEGKIKRNPTNTNKKVKFPKKAFIPSKNSKKALPIKKRRRSQPAEQQQTAKQQQPQFQQSKKKPQIPRHAK